MRRWLVPVVLLVILALTVVPFSCGTREEEKLQGEGGYQAALASYVRLLRPGMTRKEVEDYLEEKKVGFDRMGGVDGLGTDADVIKVGEERPPWFCSENYVYIALHFAARPGPRYGRSDKNEADTLKEITIYKRLSGCL